MDILIITVQDNVCRLQWQPMLLFQTICPRRTTLYKSYLTANTCKIIQVRGYEFWWFDDIGHIRGHLNSWISNDMQYYLIVQVNRWNQTF